MQQSVVISRYVLSAICALIVILVIALFISLTQRPDEKDPKSEVQAASAWIQGGPDVPISGDLKAHLMKEHIYSLLLFQEGGKFQWVGLDGKEFPICGEIVEGKITGCGIEGKKVELTTFTEFTVIGTKASDCVLGKHLGKTAWVHRYPPGHTYPCHH